jgi:hypothetical protein
LGPHSPKSSPLGAGEADSQRNQAGLDTNLRQFMKNAPELGTKNKYHWRTSRQCHPAATKKPRPPQAMVPAFVKSTSKLAHSKGA